MSDHSLDAPEMAPHLMPDLVEEYAGALASHIAHGDEASLHHAYKFGRKAMREGLGLLEMTMLHYQALVLLAVRAPGEMAGLSRTAEFLVEALSPFEMALRGWHDTADRLRQANDELEARVSQRTAAHLGAVERLDRAQQVAGMGSVEWEPKSGEQIWSRQLYRICGLPEGPHPPGAHDIFQFIDPADRERHQEWVAWLKAGGDPGPIEYRILRPDGHIRIVRAEGEAAETGVISFTLQDVTEQRAAEAQLRDLQAELAHAARLSAMGHMSAAIIHELNQPMTAIRNYTNAALRFLAQGDEAALAKAKGALERTGDQAVRGGHIIDRLRGFAAQGESALRAEMLMPLLRETVDLLRVGTRTDDVRIRLAGEVPNIAVLADKIQVQQVLLNLLRNAVEALAGQPRKEIAIVPAMDGDFVRISVIDSGPGLAEEVKAKLFQPFVSTKKTGMGIGLSICYNIVSAHHGRLWAEANPAGGTIFHLTLPMKAP
jgi:two-component system sensor kinase FixL